MSRNVCKFVIKIWNISYWSNYIKICNLIWNEIISDTSSYKMKLELIRNLIEILIRIPNIFSHLVYLSTCQSIIHKLNRRGWNVIVESNRISIIKHFMTEFKNWSRHLCFFIGNIMNLNAFSVYFKL